MTARGRGALLLAALVAALAATLFVVSAASGEERAGQAAVTGLAEVRRAPLVRRIDAKGELRSTDAVTIGAPAIPRFWNFTVTMIAEEGVEVAPGVPLLAFDSQQLGERLQQRMTQLDTARKELEKLTLEQQETLDRFVLELAEIESKRRRLAQLLDIPAELQSRLELEKTRLDGELAEQEERLARRRVEVQRATLEKRIGAAASRVRELEAEVASLGAHIEKMTVRAPRAGYVVHVADWGGEKMKVGQSMWHGRQVIELADLASMEVAAEIAEPDAGYVRAGQAVEVRLDAAPDRVFHGSIESLGRLFHARSGDDPTMVFDAVVSIEDPDPGLMRPGMAARVVILSETPEPVLQVPEGAIVRGPDGPEVRVRRGSGDPVAVPVSLGPRWRGQVIVTGDVREGESVEVRHGS